MGKRLESWAFPKEKYPGRVPLVMQWIAQDLSPGAVVLDCGAGRGKTRYFLGEKVQKVVGIDRSDEVRKNDLVSEAYVCDACRTPFSDGTFDAIFAVSVLEHIESPDFFLTEMVRILKPGGGFYFVAPNSYHYFVWISRAISDDLARWIQELRGLPVADHFPTFYRLNSPRVLRKKATEAGFTRVQLRFYEGADVVTYFPTVLKPAGIAYAKLVNWIPFLSRFRGIIIGRMTK